MSMNKRDFLKAFVACTATGIAPFEIASASPSNQYAANVGRVLSGQGFLNMGDFFSEQEPFLLDAQRNGERFKIDLRTKEGYEAARYLLRDIRDGNTKGYPNPYLLRLAAWFQAYVAQNYQYTVLNITSGLRTSKTNSRIEGAAQNSKHLTDEFGFFHAMDVKPIGLDVGTAGEVMRLAKNGGVGWYNTHVHFDIREKTAYWGKVPRR